MSYLVLARKFRPQNFDEIIGQEHISQTLKNAISQNRIAHAYLFSGPKGCGKTTMARVFAKALNCKNGPTTKPCGKCENCLSILKSSSIDVLEIDGASNNGIDEIRTLRENVKFASANSKYKIYIIDEAHQITTQAFNALLKTLEEPPSHVVFIMATTEQHKIPVTIVSRCQRYRFKLISSFEMIPAIKNIGQKEKFEIDAEALNIIVKASGGSMRDALSLLDQAISSSNGKVTAEYIRNLLGILPKEIMIQITENIAQGNAQSILQTVKEINEQGYNILQFAKDLMDHLRQIMIYSINPSILEISSDEKKKLNLQKKLFTMEQHVRMNNLLSKALEEMRWHDDPRIIIEMYLLKISEPYYNINELIKRISDTEKSVKFDTSTQFHQNSKKENKIQETETNTNKKKPDLINIWNDTINEIIQKHSLTAQFLKKIPIKILEEFSILLTTYNQFDYKSIMEFKEQILKALKEKTNLDITIKINIEKNNTMPHQITQENLLIKKENKIDIENMDKENFKEEVVPKHIEEIAKKFGSIAKKI
ncbi:MAG: DNA polymerase III subunit gamma/tau [Endomicrobium sp.]|jgi:DNA polymerase-3 subunit gamma/tau|nr:DNA polymerase III subunit gamma/tau [Endomicrobium sp.]